MTWNPNPLSNDEELSIHVINVEHGDCIIIELPGRQPNPEDPAPEKKSTKKTSQKSTTKKSTARVQPIAKQFILVDTRNFFDNWVINYINNFLGFTRAAHTFTCGVVSHGHEDHIKDYITYVNRLHIPQVFIVNTDIRFETSLITDLRLRIPTQGSRVTDAVSGNTICNVNGATVKIIGPSDIYKRKITSPPHRISTHATNNLSQVLQITFGSHRIILPGDAERSAWRSLIPSLQNNTSLLKVAHHGSRTGTTQDMLAAMHPRVSIISLGGLYDLPHQETLDWLRATPSILFRTDDPPDPAATSHGNFGLMSYVFRFNRNNNDINIYQILYGANADQFSDASGAILNPRPANRGRRT